MKKKNNRISISILKPTKLYINNIETIIFILNDFLDEVVIENNEYQFENLDEVSELYKERIHALSVIGYQESIPKVFVDVRPRVIQIISTSDGREYLGAIEQLKELFSKHKKHTLENPDTYSLIALWLSSYSLVQVVINFIKQDFQYTGFQFLFGIILLGVWFYVFRSPPKNTIHLQKAKDSSTFLERNLDKILLTIIGLVLAYLFKFVTDLIP